MESRLFGFLAETSIHPGSGQDTGLIHLPVAREKTTDYPVVYGSALKGAMRDAIYWRHYEKLLSANGDDPSEKDCKACAEKASVEADRLFGSQDAAGPVLVSDLRLLMLPVRSLTASYFWVTCPHLVERSIRDVQRGGFGSVTIEFPSMPEETKYLGGDEADGPIYLEKRNFDRAGPLPDGLAGYLKRFVPHQTTQNRIENQLRVISDPVFAWFARYGLAVNARNVLDEETKSSKNLWYEETIPADTLFYCLLGGRHRKELQDVSTKLLDQEYLQVGGNETVGQGWMALQQVESLAEALA